MMKSNQIPGILLAIVITFFGCSEEDVKHVSLTVNGDYSGIQEEDHQRKDFKKRIVFIDSCIQNVPTCSYYLKNGQHYDLWIHRSTGGENSENLSVRVVAEDVQGEMIVHAIGYDYYFRYYIDEVNYIRFSEFTTLDDDEMQKAIFYFDERSGFTSGSFDIDVLNREKFLANGETLLCNYSINIVFESDISELIQ